MKSICNENTCTGCAACINLCPNNAIIIEDDLETYNAKIDPNRCINCGLCVKYCPNNCVHSLRPPIYWVQGWAEDEIRKQSSSGGAASALTRFFIQSGGYVASCLFENGVFRFVVTNSIEKAKGFAGSKYVKSNPGTVYREIQRLLKAGEKVLFIGLPCQSAAVQTVCGSQEKLYTVDLICHGTPSLKLLKQFLYECGLTWTNINDIKFRDSEFFGLSVNGMRLTPHRTIDSYSRVFLHGVDYTENCYSCRYATLNRVSDITLGDAWGQMSQTERGGVSLILCQTEKGIELVECAALHLEEVNLKKAIEANHQLKHPSVKHPGRERFFNMIKTGHSVRRATVAILPKESVKQSIKMGLIRTKLFKDF